MTAAPWLTVIGIGEDGRAGLTQAALARLTQAELVVGGKRHLMLAGPIAGESLVWPSPLSDALPAIFARRGRPVVVLATGDPFVYGVGSVLADHVPAAEMDCLPGASAFSLAAARLGWAVQDCTTLTLHGRAFARLRPHLQPGARLLVLSWDGSTPGRIAAELVERGMGGSRLVVFEAMGGPRERCRAMRAAEFAETDIDPLNTVAITVEAGPEARVIPRAPGLPDGWFESDGQITKREIRAVTLAALAPTRGGMLWDVGAGSGSVGIEWMLCDPANRAIAIEPRADRAARIDRNAESLGVPDLAVRQGRAPEALAGLPPPSAIFIGGGFGDPAIEAAAFEALPVGGRLVVNAVTIETQALLAAAQARRGGDLVHLQVARAEPVGGFRGFRPAMAVVQWSLTKR